MPKEPSFHRQSLRPNTIRSLYTSSWSSNRNVRQTLHGNTTVVLESASGPSAHENTPIDDGGIDFDEPGDGDSGSQAPIEEDMEPEEPVPEPEEPVPGVRCVPKPKAKRYENSVSCTQLNSFFLLIFFSSFP